MDTLLGISELDPVNREIAFIERDAAVAADELARWLGSSLGSHVRVDVSKVEGDLLDVGLRLWPLTAPLSKRFLILQTGSSWSSYLDNGVEGPDAANIASQLARRLNCRGVRIAATADRAESGKRVSYGAAVFELFSPSGVVRSVGVVNDGGRWVFDEVGEPLPGEPTAIYQSRTTRNRVTADHLRDLAAMVGLRPFDRAFFESDGRARGVFVECSGVRVTREVKRPG